MKRNFIGTLALVVLSMLLSAPSSFAQDRAKANVPFAFQVGKAELPAGTYVVASIDQGVISIKNGNTSEGVLALVRTEYSNKAHSHNPRLVFHRYGNKYFLTEVWGDGDAGMKLPTSKMEKELSASNSGPSSEQEIIFAMK